MKLANSTWPMVEEYLRTQNSILIPIGSTEQHGPTGLIGTDYLTAQIISETVAEKLNIMSAPPICYGMALHHLDFPGSVALKPSTLMQVVIEIVESLKRHGFEKFIFVNGHGGNNPTLTASFSELKADEDESILEVINWWKLPEVETYQNEHFKNENGFHATIGEVAVTKWLEPKAFEKIPNTQFKIEIKKHHWPLSPSEFRNIFPDGRMESNPGLATSEHGKKIFDIAVDAIVRRTEAILKM